MKFSIALLTAAVAGPAVARPSTLDRILKSRQGSALSLVYDAPHIYKPDSGTNDLIGSSDWAVKSNGIYWTDRWAGAGLAPPRDGLIKSVTARSKLGAPTHIGRGPEDQYSAAAIGIDGGVDCDGGFLEAGILTMVSKTGAVSYTPWYQYMPGNHEILECGGSNTNFISFP
ncbi:hypothetical protein ACEQ8H_001306 [Pleosporales sp. CAS-2024a]